MGAGRDRWVEVAAQNGWWLRGVGLADGNGGLTAKADAKGDKKFAGPGGLSGRDQGPVGCTEEDPGVIGEAEKGGPFGHNYTPGFRSDTTT